MDYLANDNIIVCSSGHISNVAISKIRLSGKLDLNLLSNLFSKKLDNLKSRYAHYINIVDDNEIVDDVICIIFRAPNSYTGEDLIELDVHGSILNVQRIINLFITKAGFRHASPGEFSYRALKNKKLSLSQVEGLDLILNAKSIFSLKQGRSLISGKIRNDFEQLYNKFLTHKSALELGIDFLEDVGEEHAQKLFNDSLKELMTCINKLNIHVINNSGSILEPTISLIGEPNAGKSTFFNSLLFEDRSIVSDIAGTTRDYVSESIFFNNIQFKLVDTAGLRESIDKIEAIGVQRSLELAKNSFVNILVINPLNFNEANYNHISSKPIDLIVFTHSDQPGFNTAISNVLNSISSLFGPIEPLKNIGPIEPNDSGSIGAGNVGPIGPDDKVRSIKYIYNGIDKNSEIELFSSFIVGKYEFSVKNEPFLVSRHSNLIGQIYDLAHVYANFASKETDISIISLELNMIGNCISELIGIVSPDDVLHNIFDNFCIGK